MRYLINDDDVEYWIEILERHKDRFKNTDIKLHIDINYILEQMISYSKLYDSKDE